MEANSIYACTMFYQGRLVRSTTIYKVFNRKGIARGRGKEGNIDLEI